MTGGGAAGVGGRWTDMVSLTEAREWVESAIAAWREAARDAGVGAPEGVLNLASPTQVAVYFCRDLTVEATCLWVRHDAGRPDQEVQLIEVAPRRLGRGRRPRRRPRAGPGERALGGAAGKLVPWATG